MKTAVCLVMLFLYLNGHLAYAIVGQAEEYDPFRQEDLNDFQESITNEELKDQLDNSDLLSSMIKQKQKQAKSTDDVSKDYLNEEIDKLKVELLKLPKRDKFQAEFTGAYNFTTNANRAVINSEKNDSEFNLRGGGTIDLSGRKTDLKLSSEVSREWNWEFDENDVQEFSESLSYRRKYFKKTTHSAKLRINRNNSKTIEINADKIRWDIVENTAYNYPFSKKLSLNTDFGGNKRYFPQEAFDQDSAVEVTSAPSAFWNITPKSRVSLGYNFGANRIRSKAGDANSQGVKIGYFGKVTKKSSSSIDLGISHQTPKSRETSTINTIATGAGYIWQITPKTQVTIQYIRSLQNTTSNLVSGEVDGENATSKEDVHFSNNSLSFSMNSRLTRKLNTVINFSPAHLKTKSDALSENKDTETQQLNFPISIESSYFVTPKLILTVRYTFSYRTGDEHLDKIRVHSLDAMIRWVI